MHQKKDLVIETSISTCRKYPDEAIVAHTINTDLQGV